MFAWSLFLHLPELTFAKARFYCTRSRHCVRCGRSKPRETNYQINERIITERSVCRPQAVKPPLPSPTTSLATHLSYNYYGQISLWEFSEGYILCSGAGGKSLRIDNELFLIWSIVLTSIQNNISTKMFAHFIPRLVMYVVRCVISSTVVFAIFHMTLNHCHFTISVHYYNINKWQQQQQLFFSSLFFG